SANTPYPATYYTNITTIRNVGTSPHSIKSIQIFNIASTSSSDFGNITVYYCTTQTEFDANGKLATPSNCVGSYSITSTTSGSISGTFPQSIAASTTQYIEIVGYAGSGATTADTITFTSAIQWL
ncbi:MAG: hypothetical protein JRN20_21920, partial [Nitrososphaerota archaeon]|nr:hypothetical protein [Nitrososphaerota archaeon]